MHLLWFLVGVGLGLVLGILVSAVFRKSRNKVEREQPSAAGLDARARDAYGRRGKGSGQYVQRCPACNSTYTDETLSYCVSDGEALVPVSDKSAPYDPSATALYPEARGRRELPPTEPYRPNRSSN